MTDSPDYDVFISYARRDDVDGWVSGLRDAIYEDFRAFSSEPFRIFFDTTEIHTRQDWELRLRQGLRTSRVLLVCLSPNYLRSAYCRWEWDEFTRLAGRRIGSGDPVTGVYFVELGGDEQYGEQIAEWRHQVEQVQLEQLQPWFPDGVKALQNAEVRRRVAALGVGVADQVRQARLAKTAPGNLRRHNPLFVGRVAELRALRHLLTGGAVGVVTAVHGIGGVGKTELAVSYAHAYAHTYQGGTWQVDADGYTDVLEAISTLALWPELGLTVSDEQLKDRTWLGRRVLARLTELTDNAREQDPSTGRCLLLLDNVSEPALLAESQLAVLPDQPWFHLAATTRLGVSDVAAAGSRASVAMIEVGRLAKEDAVALIREHQPARDPARLQPDFSNAQEADAARLIVELLDGYTLAVEQAAVYLGSSGTPPSQLLEVLSAHGAAILDDVGGSAEGAAAILHKEKITAVIVDQTLARLSGRARDALALASLLPPDSVPWQWLRQLTEPSDSPSPPHVVRLPGLSGSATGDDWAATRRGLEGRRLLTGADNPQFARLHRVLGHHLRIRLADPDTNQRLDTHLQHTAQQLKDATAPDTALLAVTATTIADRLAAGRHDLATAGLRLIEQVQQRLDLASADTLATATLASCQHLSDAEPDNTEWLGSQAVSLNRLGEVLSRRGDKAGALEHYTRSLHIFERLAESDPHNADRDHDLSIVFNNVGDVLKNRGDTAGALHHYIRGLQITERLAESDPHNARCQNDLAISLERVGGVLLGRGDTVAALDHYTRSLHIFERLAQSDPDNTEWQQDMSFGLLMVGNVLRARGDTVGALEHYTRTLHTRERLAQSDPLNTDWQQHLSHVLFEVGNVLAAQRNTAAALEHYTRALHIVERLSAADPHNTVWQTMLAVYLRKVGDELDVQRDTTGALHHYARSTLIAERLAATDPHNTRWQHSLATSVSGTGHVLAAQGDMAAALEHYTRALHILEALVDTDPHVTLWQHDLAVANLYWMGHVLARQGDMTGALERYTRGLHILEALVDTDPHNTAWQRDVAVSAYRVASVLESAGDPSAVEYWANAHRIIRALDGAGELRDSDRAALDYLTDKLGPT